MPDDREKLARVISCAPLIMTSVFAAFLLSTNVTVKMPASASVSACLSTRSSSGCSSCPQDRITGGRPRKGKPQRDGGEAQPASAPATGPGLTATPSTFSMPENA